MKRYQILASAFALALGLISCAQLEEFDQDVVVPEAGEKIKVVLNAERGASVKSSDTRVYVGSTSGGAVTYYWNDNDQIGVVPLNIRDSRPNYHSAEKEIHSNRNYATFNAYITSDGFDTSQNPHLFIYYPYNDSMLEGNTGTTGSSFIGPSQGLTFRLPQLQDQYKYSRTLGASEHPSAWALSQYGLAYDLAGCQTSTEGNDVTSTGEFTLDHANSYFQFNVYGTQSQGSDNNYGDGTWRLASVAVEAGHCELGTDEEGNTVYTLTDQVDLAGTYKITYDYVSTHFDDVSGKTNNDRVTVTNVIPQKSVKVTMRDAATSDGAILGGTKATGAPAFATINGLGIKNNVKGNLNCMKVSVTAYRYDENGNVTNSDTRVRFYNIEKSIAGKDISGNYYTIDFEFCDPVESYTDLSLEGTASCYVIGAPGNYTFTLDVAGNGKVPFGGFKANVEDPNNLMDDPTKYGFTWLWASGLSFDKFDDGVLSDKDIVRKVLNSEEISGEDGRVSIGLATGSTENLSGNIVLALYKKNSDGTAGEIVWTWHLWLGQPLTQHYKFSSTNRNWNFTNEDWFVLDRNLGAESSELGNARSTGLFYQRGRKEPMIGFKQANGSKNWKSNQIPTYRNTEVFGSRAVWESGVAYSGYNTFSMPMSLITGIPYSGNSDYNFAWNASQGADNADDISNDVKSMFDPCPAGYRMPTTREWDNMKADKFRWTIGGQGFGVFGYCIWDGLIPSLSSTDDDERIVEYAMHSETDHYEVNNQFERTYYINANSGIGSQIITNFPNTGILYSNDGTWNYTYQGSWTATVQPEIIHHPAGPRVTAEIITGGNTVTPPIINSASKPSSTSSYSTVTFASNKTYYYSIGNPDPGTTKSFTGATARLYVTNTSNSNASYLSLGLTSNGSKTVYFYTKDSNGNSSEASTVTITRSGSWLSTNLTAELNNATTSSQYLQITFNDGDGMYYHAFSQTGNKTVFSGRVLSIPCSFITLTTGNRVVYLYTMSEEGVYSTATTVSVNYSNSTYTLGTIVRGEAKDESIGGGTENNSGQSTMVVWSAGRVNDDGKYDQFWFGPASSTSDGWATPVNGDWGRENDGGKNTAPFSERRETHVMGVFSWGINDYNSKKSYDPAIPIRCMREYDNASTATVAE